MWGAASVNRILQGYFQRIERELGRIEQAADTARQEIARLKEDKQRITQQYWARGRKASVLAESQERYEAVQAENDLLREKLQQARAHASRIRALAHALKEGSTAHGGG